MSSSIVGVVLAGGKSRRMKGDDKCFLPFGSTSLLGYVLERVKLQVSDVIINSNHSNSLLREYSAPIVPDEDGERSGPLVGILSTMKWVKTHHPDCKHIASFPVDSPFFPNNLVATLFENINEKDLEIAIPRYGDQSHWATGLWSLELIPALEHFMEDRQNRRTQDWIKSQNYTAVLFNEYEKDPFYNINTPEHYQAAIERFEKAEK